MTEDKMYSAIEAAIIRWSLDGTKTAGELTREIMSLTEQEIKFKDLFNDEKRQSIKEFIDKQKQQDNG
jgi:hypothetical protein